MLSVLETILVLSHNRTSSKVLRKKPNFALVNGKYPTMPKTRQSYKNSKKEKGLKAKKSSTSFHSFCSPSGSPSRYNLDNSWMTDYWKGNVRILPDISQQQFYCPIFFNSSGPVISTNSTFLKPQTARFNYNYFSFIYFHTNSTETFEKNTLFSGDCRKSSYRKLRAAKRKYKREKMVIDYRFWEDVQNESSLSGPGIFFTVMTYNVLAQDLIGMHPSLYKNHRADDLQWTKRWLNLKNEIKCIFPDILCLQEVQESHLNEYYSQLENIGYKGIFKKRTGERIDGCAIYYKHDKVILTEYTTVEYYQPNVSVLNRDNIAIIAKFAPKSNPFKEFVVATTHLLYNPRRNDVRLAQTQLLLAEIERISFKNVQERYNPIIITGDFNSPPESPLYEFITKGELQYEEMTKGKVLVPPHLGITDSCQHAELVERRQNNEPPNREQELALIELHNSDNSVKKTVKRTTCNPEMFCSGRLCHHFPFKSVYNHYHDDDVEGTTFQDKWHTVDYIFYSGKKDKISRIEEHKLRLLSRYRLPTAGELENLRIPSDCLGSDHLSLVARFKLEFT